MELKYILLTNFLTQLSATVFFVERVIFLGKSLFIMYCTYTKITICRLHTWAPSLPLFLQAPSV